jgi:hypothetical protein
MRELEVGKMLKLKSTWRTSKKWKSGETDFNTILWMTITTRRRINIILTRKSRKDVSNLG